MSVPEWKKWFTSCVHEILLKLAEGECAIFYQTDVKVCVAKRITTLDCLKQCIGGVE